MRRARTAARSVFFSAAVLVGALGAQQRPLTAPPDRRIELDFQHYYTPAELSQALRELAEAYPEFLSVESIARTPGGHDVWIVTASDARGPDASQRPAIFVAGSLGSGDLEGVEMVLSTVYEMVQNQARDPAMARRLQECVFYFAPCLDPDQREQAFAAFEAGPGAGPPAVVEVDLRRNFPVGWRAHSGGGPYPLSAAESRSVAQFLLSHANVAVVQTYGAGPARSSEWTTGGPDRALYARLQATLGSADLLPVYPRVAFGEDELQGGLLEFAGSQLGAFAFRTDAGGAPDDSHAGVPSVDRLASLGQRAARTTFSLAQWMPHLELGPPTVQRLKNDQWQIEVSVTNRGPLPTAGELATAHRAVPAPRLNVRGVELVAAMAAGATDGVYRVLDHDAEAVALPQLGGAETLAVRLVVVGAPGGSAALEVLSTRAGVDWAQAALE